MICYQMKWTEQEFNSQNMSFIFALIDWMDEKASMEKKELQKQK